MNTQSKKERSYILDMGYESMWSLVEDLSSEELREESERLKNEINEYYKKEQSIKRDEEEKRKKIAVLEKILKQRDDKILEKIIPTEEHKKLLKEMRFVEYKDGGDYVLIGCDGKRPFGNSYIYGDIAKILDWKLPNDDLSDEQREKADQLLKELPFVINNIFKNL